MINVVLPVYNFTSLHFALPPPSLSLTSVRLHSSQKINQGFKSTNAAGFIAHLTINLKYLNVTNIIYICILFIIEMLQPQHFLSLHSLSLYSLLVNTNKPIKPTNAYFAAG